MGTQPSDSKCYWIQLGAYKRTMSFIRKCDKNSIPSTSKTAPKNQACNDTKISKEGDPFKDGNWNHFVIQKFQNFIEVFQETQLIMSYFDNNTFIPKKMYIGSDTVALWKIHSYTFLESTTSSTSSDNAVATIKVSNRSICISMFIKTSNASELQIRVKRPYEPDIFNQSFRTNGQWRHEKIFKTNISYNNYTLYFIKPNSENNYWAIDDVRECSEKEYRYIEANGYNLSCQKIEDSKTITLDNNSKPIIEDINCEENSFAVGCVPCKLFNSNYCWPFIYCQLIEDTAKCFCSAGYTNSSCTEPCNSGYYGHGCKKKCHCQNTYDSFSGDCKDQCQKPFIGFHCDKAMVPFFKSAPKVTEIYENKFEITQIDLECEGNGTSYYFQYRQGDKLNWTTIKENITLNISKKICVENGKDGAVVESDTYYIARSIISGNTWNDSELTFLPNVSFTTKCKKFQEKDIIITSSNTTAYITFQDTSLSCKLNNYSFYLNEKKIKDYYLTGLNPNTNYKMYIFYMDTFYLTKSFTTEGVPSIPYNLTYYWSKENELYLVIYHSNKGHLKSFEIQIYEKRIDKPIIDGNLIYTLEINNIFMACTEFCLRIRAKNDYGASNFTGITIKSPPTFPPNITKTLFNITSTTIGLDVMIAKSVDVVYIIVSPDIDTDDTEEFKKYLCKGQENEGVLNISRILYKETRIYNINFIIGNNKSNTNFLNTPLNPGKKYSITIILSNKCNQFTKINSYRYHIITKTSENTNEPIGNTENEGLWALVLLIFIPFMLFGIWYIKKQQPNIFKPQSGPEDQLVLTDTLTDNLPILKPKVKPKPTPNLVLPALATKYSKKIRIIDFENYVKESIESGELERQHNLFPKGLLKPHEIGLLPINKTKNRYKNLIAYDHTRVKIKHLNIKSSESDYINANYIDGYRKPRTYIATQGPKLNTLNDFWFLIWQTNVKNIIMLANIFENGKKKVEKYWPDINEHKTYGNINVQYLSSTVFANFDERTFCVSCNGTERKITQLHFTTWPDHGIPLYSQSLVPFLQKMLKMPYATQSPILVHCSAGVGRTGTIILSDICLRMAAGEGYIDFLAHLENLRNQRANLVDNIDQYKLAHLVVFECLFGMRTAIPCTEDMETIIDSTISNNGIKTQMKYILETQWLDSAMETVLENEVVLPIFHEKNRIKDIVPEHYRIHITKYPYEDETSSYINAVLVDGFRSTGRFIVTQQPMPNTIGDFWRLVWERSCATIVSLNFIDLKDETMCQIWPEKNQELNPVDFLKIVHKKTRTLDFYSNITTEVLTTQNETNSLTVNILAMNNWMPQDVLPNRIEEFLAFIDAADALSRTSENIIVTCYDGAKASGLFVAMSFLIEKMKLEQECDVCLAVRCIRHSRKEFILSEEQYEFLYRACLTFIKGFQPYSNFT